MSIKGFEKFLIDNKIPLTKNIKQNFFILCNEKNLDNNQIDLDGFTENIILLVLDN